MTHVELIVDWKSYGLWGDCRYTRIGNKRLEVHVIGSYNIHPYEGVRRWYIQVENDTNGVPYHPFEIWSDVGTIDGIESYGTLEEGLIKAHKYIERRFMRDLL